MPRSTEALRFQTQLLLQFDRLPDAAEPLKDLLAISAPPERVAADRQPAARAAARQGQGRRGRAVPPAAAALHGRARHARGRARGAGPHPPEPGPADVRARPRRAGAGADPKALPPVLLALDVMNSATDGSRRARPRAQRAAAVRGAARQGHGAVARLIAKAEAIVKRYLAQPDAAPVVRQAYASVLATQQRLTDAAEQLRLALEVNPQQPALWLALGEIDLELHDPVTADVDLRQRAHARHRAGRRRGRGTQGAADAAGATAVDDDDDAPDRRRRPRPRPAATRAPLARPAAAGARRAAAPRRRHRREVAVASRCRRTPTCR